MHARVQLFDDDGAPIGTYEGDTELVSVSPDTVESPLLAETGEQVGLKLDRTGKVSMRVLFDTFEVS